MSLVQKKVVSGSIHPRWTKSRVVRWLQIGGLGAAAGLWLPDWAGGYIAWSHAGNGPLAVPFPPVLAYIGAAILCKGCLESIRDMGWHYRAARAMATLATWLAVASFGWQCVVENRGPSLAMLLVSIGLTAFSVTCVVWLTTAKVAEIAGDPRARVSQDIVLALNLAALGATAVAALAVVSDGPWETWLRVAVTLFTAALLGCCYGAYSYQQQTSIGAAFAFAPDDQFWV